MADRSDIGFAMMMMAVALFFAFTSGFQADRHNLAWALVNLAAASAYGTWAIHTARRSR